MENTSLSLLHRVCGGSDAQSWQALAEIYTPILRRWLQRYELQGSDVDDLVQDVLLTVSRELPQFRHSGRSGAFRSWLRIILVNRVRYFWRQRRYRPVATGDTGFLASLDELADPNSGLSALWNREHDRNLIQVLLSHVEKEFSESTLTAFRRVVLDGVPAAEVANELGLSLNAVVIAKCRVLKELRRGSRGLLGE